MIFGFFRIDIEKIQEKRINKIVVANTESFLSVLEK